MISIVLLISVAFATGIAGLISLAIIFIVSQLRFGRDPQGKHGLSSGNSRLGGIAVICSAYINLFVYTYVLDYPYPSQINHQEMGVMELTILAIGFIGLIEDVSQQLGSLLRLFAMIIIIALGLWYLPELLPIKLDVWFNTEPQSFSIMLYLFTIIMTVGFINAGNISDGANGLLVTIYLAFFIVLLSFDHSVLYVSLIIALLTFALYNILVGKIILGDFGAYVLSALVALNCLKIYGENDVSVFLFASLLVYPCFEILRSFILRILTGASPFDPDNNHFHNYVNKWILSMGYSRHKANSLTGIGIACLTSGPPFLIFMNNETPASDLWLYVFMIEILILFLLYFLLLRTFRHTTTSRIFES